MGEKYIGMDIDKVEVYSKLKKLAKKYGKVATIEVKKRDPYIPPSLEKKLRETLPKMRAITPNKLALTNDIRVSSAKKFLNDLVEEGLVEVVSGSSRIKVYRGSEVKEK